MPAQIMEMPSVLQSERERERKVMHWVTFNYTCVYVCTCDAQHSSQLIKKGFKKAENSEQNVVLLLFLFTLNNGGC